MDNNLTLQFSPFPSLPIEEQPEWCWIGATISSITKEGYLSILEGHSFPPESRSFQIKVAEGVIDDDGKTIMCELDYYLGRTVMLGIRLNKETNFFEVVQVASPGGWCWDET